MDPAESTKDKKGFTVLVIVSFISVTFFLLFIQYVSFHYTDAVFEENNHLIRENVRMSLEKKYGGTKSFVETRIEAGDTVLLVTIADKAGNPLQSDSRIVLTDKDNRDLAVFGRLAWNAASGRKYSYLVIGTILFLGAALCWLIIWQFRKLNRLVFQLDIAEKKAQEALIMKENFLANMSHEIRTPLNSIIGFTKLIKRRSISPDVAEFTGAIEQAGDNLLRIVNDVLDLSKIEAGMLTIVKRPFRLRKVMHTVEKLFSERLQEKDLRLSVSIDPDVPDVLSGDDSRLTQILVNLIGNAIKFSPQGQIRVTVFGEHSTSSEVVLAFRVRDEGIGIAPEKLSEIFERFTQAEEATARKYGGTGLGLAIVRDLVSLQRGTIEIQSEPGTGTEICFRLPFAITDEEPEHAVVPVLPPDIAIAGLRILVADDNIMNQSLMRQLLENWKINCNVASDGNEAVELLRQQHFDLVLMDIQMPNMDGFTAVKYIRENLGLSVPVIAMTASVREGEKEKCMENGMDGYISKPVSEAGLLELIGRFTAAAALSRNSATPNQSPFPDFHYIDLTYIKEVSNGSITYEKTVTQQFIDLIPDALQSLRVASENEDFKTVRQIAHHMQTTLAIMGIVPKYAHLLDALENADSGQPGKAAMDELMMICTAAVTEAREFYASLPK